MNECNYKKTTVGTVYTANYKFYNKTHLLSVIILVTGITSTIPKCIDLIQDHHLGAGTNPAASPSTYMATRNRGDRQFRRGNPTPAKKYKVPDNHSDSTESPGTDTEEVTTTTTVPTITTSRSARKRPASVEALKTSVP